ncbi:MAG: HEAT repeat domain-containing protein [Sedimentisphaerales bacterium]|nr:HEAT repeat domain-containing protein [Sedimentisphaerales bacterium]
MRRIEQKRKSGTGLYLIFMVTVLILSVISGCKETIAKIEPLGGVKVEKLKPKALRVVEEGLSDTDPKIQTKAIEVIAAAGQKQLMPKVQAHLFNDYIPVRFAAALAIGDTEYYPARNQLSTLLNASDENTKIAAAYALYKLGHKQYLEIIKNAVKSPDQTVRANAVVLLGKSGDESVLELLYRAKDDEDSERRVRYLAVEAIARLGDEKIIEKIWTLLISKFVDNKLIGIRAMGALGTRKAEDVLITKLDDDILEVRLTAAEQLGKLSNQQGQEQVIQIFEDKLILGMDSEDKERVLVLAALAIGSIDTEELTKYLPKLVDDESKLVRLAAAQAILKSRVK